jgi:hypothetical protein
MKRYILYALSYSPLIAILVVALISLFMVIIKIISALYQVGIAEELIWYKIIMPFIVLLVMSSTIITVFMTIKHWKNILETSSMSKKDKLKWKKLFILNPICANSFYFEYKYKKDGVDYVFNDFLEKTRDKLSGYVDIPKLQ